MTLTNYETNFVALRLQGETLNLGNESKGFVCDQAGTTGGTNNQLI